MKRVIEELERLCVLHEHLLSLSEQKTEALKTNEIKALSEIVTKEQKYVQAIEQTEQSRIEATKSCIGRLGRDDQRMYQQSCGRREKGAGTAVCQALTARHPFEGCERFEQAADFSVASIYLAYI